ncbi:MAG: hypothetical protein OHK0039_33060 [Bacteroidia bacterium]
MLDFFTFTFTPMNTPTFRLSAGLLLVLILFAACKREKLPLDLPDAYDASTFAASTTTEAAVRTALANLTREMQLGRTAGTTVALTSLSDLYAAGSPSLASITTTYYRGRIEGAEGWLANIALASGGTYTPGEPQGNGGVYGGYLLDENGLELEQLVEKGLFSAAMYHHAVSLMQGTITRETADRLVSIFGAHPDFPNTTTAANAANPDRFMAQYGARRDKNDGTGLYSQMEAAFIQLQAAIEAGEEYDEERDEALETLRSTWEKICFATVINYCHTAISKLSATNPTDADKASAIHAYGEAVGFTHGWRTLPQGYRTITDSQIDALLVLLNAPYDGTPTSYKFLTDPVNELPKLVQVIDDVQVIYGFTDQEVEDFRENWVSKQGR